MSDKNNENGDETPTSETEETTVSNSATSSADAQSELIETELIETEITSVDRKRLSEACDNATELVAYLSSKGNLPETISTSDFFNILAKARNEKLDSSEEPIFWSNYSQLATHALPVQIEALKFRNYMLDRNKADTRERVEYKRSLSDIFRISLISLTSFFFTLIFLSYVSLTSSYLATNIALTKEHQLIEARVFTGTRLAVINKSSKSNPLNFGDDTGSESNETETFIGPSADQDGFQAILSNLSQDAIREINDHIEYNLSALEYLQLKTASFARSTNNQSPEQIQFSSVLLHRAQIEAHQGLINQLISSYLLPLFTSLLGVTVFILRRTSASLNSGQYRLYESSTYSYRLTLGVVGGIVISWFSTADTTGVVASLTPAALAFVVGYSIEVLYNVLDSIVKALGASDK